MRLGIIIPYYKQPEQIIVEHIKACIESTLKPDEIILVNDGSGVDLLPTLKTIAKPKNINIIYATIIEDIQWNQAGALNLGIWLSNCDVFSFEGVDSFPLPTYYEKAMAKINEGFDQVFGLRFSRDTANGVPGLYLIRRTVLVDIGGIDEDFAGHYGYEDVYMNELLKRNKCKTCILTEQGIKHDERGITPKETIPKMVRNIEYNHKLLLEKLKTLKNSSHKLRFNFTVDRF